MAAVAPTCGKKVCFHGWSSPVRPGSIITAVDTYEERKGNEGGGRWSSAGMIYIPPA
jgi:hypothetical protein